MHAGNGDITDLGRRFVRCFVAAADDAQLPADPAFREALRAYMEWAVDDVLTYSAEDSTRPRRHGDAALGLGGAGGGPSGPGAAGDVQHLAGDEPGPR